QVRRRRDGLRAVLPAAEFRVGDAGAVAGRIAEIEARDGRAVQLVGRGIVAHLVASVVGEPEDVRLRVPVEADGIADAVRVDLPLLPVGRDAGDGGEDRVL